MEQELHSTAEHVAAHPVGMVTEHAAGHAELWYQTPQFWVALAFVGFLFVFLRYAWPAVAAMLDARAAKIKEQLEQAAKLKAEAEALLKEYEKQKRAAVKEAKTIVEQAKRDAEALRARAKEELKVSLARRNQQAEEKIARAEADATAAIRAQIIGMATHAAREVVATQLENRKDDPAIARAITAIGQQLR